MTIVFGQLDSGGNLIYGQLDQSLQTVHDHAGVDSVALADNGTHTQDVVWDHALYANYDLYSSGTHEHLLPPTSPSYLHASSSVISLFDSGAHENISPVVVHTHSSIDVVALSADGAHVHFPGGGAGDYIHSGTSQVVLSARGTQAFTPSQFVILEQGTVPILAAWLSSEPSELEMDFSDIASDISRISFSVASPDTLFVTGDGPLGGSVAIAVELVRDGQDPLPIVSLSSAYPRATIFDYVSHAEMFEELRTLMAAGPVAFRLGGYEGFSDRTLPVPFTDSATLSVEALV